NRQQKQKQPPYQRVLKPDEFDWDAKSRGGRSSALNRANSFSNRNGDNFYNQKYRTKSGHRYYQQNNAARNRPKFEAKAKVRGNKSNKNGNKSINNWTAKTNINLNHA